MKFFPASATGKLSQKYGRAVIKDGVYVGKPRFSIVSQQSFSVGYHTTIKVEYGSVPLTVEGKIHHPEHLGHQRKRKFRTPREFILMHGVSFDNTRDWFQAINAIYPTSFAVFLIGNSAGSTEEGRTLANDLEVMFAAVTPKPRTTSRRYSYHWRKQFCRRWRAEKLTQKILEDNYGMS